MIEIIYWTTHWCKLKQTFCKEANNYGWCKRTVCSKREALRKLAHYEDLEEQYRLIELPCSPNEKVWCADEFGTRPVLYGSKSSILYDIECGKGIGYTKEEAEAKLKEAGEQE